MKAAPAAATAVLLAGCAGAAQSSPPPTGGPVAAPASTAALPTVSMVCYLARWDTTDHQWYGSASPAPVGDDIQAGQEPVVTVSLPVSAAASVEVGDITVIYYSTAAPDAASEVGSGVVPLGQVLEPGASLATGVNGVGDLAGAAPASAASCRGTEYTSG